MLRYARNDENPTWKRFVSSARMTARTCARCSPTSRTGGCCACGAIRSSHSPPVSPAPRSIATLISCIRLSGSGRRCAVLASRARAGSRRSAGTRRSTRSPSRWRRIIAESGPLALLGYAYSAHQGQMNRGLMLGLFHALGASRLIAGTVCDTCCEEAWNVTVGPVGGADPEAVEDSDSDCRLGCRSGCDQRAFLGQSRSGAAARRPGRRHRSAPEPHRASSRPASADPHRHRCRTGAWGHAHLGA